MAMVLSIPYSGFPSDVEPHQSQQQHEDTTNLGSPTSEDNDSDNDALMDSVAQQNECQQDEQGMSPSSSSNDIIVDSNPVNTIEEDNDDQDNNHVFENDDNDSSPAAATDDYWDFPSSNDYYSNDYAIVPHQEEEIDTSMNMDTESSDPLFGNINMLEQEEPSKYGGLSNLGNTCYMASALQMLASLGCSFVQDLKEQVPPAAAVVVEAGSDETEGATSAPLTLRDALLEVLDGLARGETIRPEAFKRCIDERTGLFLGYRQQDSHEFLTTLLDLLDEDYKKKDEPEEKSDEEPECKMEATSYDGGMDSSTAIDGRESQTEMAMEPSNENEEEDEQDASGIDALAGLFENEDDDQASVIVAESSSDDEEDTPSQSQLEECDDQGNSISDEETESSSQEQTVRRSSSLMNLGFGEIEELLHGNAETTGGAPVSNHMADRRDGEHKCKLVGGRMNPAQAELTRYDESKHFDLEAMSASNDTSSSKLEVVDESMSECSEIEIKSPVETNFTTEVRVSLTCESCKYRRSHTETYLHLSLELGADSCSSVDDCVRKFFAPEKREIKCEKCFHSSAMQTTEITKLPKALLFHLKRFIVDVSPDYTSISYRKNQSPVSFEETIPLEDGGDGLFEEFLAPDVVVSKGSSYAIRSVVNHIGASASCGHYTADSKREYDGEMGEEVREWTRFNDSYVSKISSTEAVANSCNTAYMIMYELEE